MAQLYQLHFFVVTIYDLDLITIDLLEIKRYY